MPHNRSSSNESLPPINLLFAEVLQRQLAQPSSPPVRRPSAWPGFPGPDKNALSTSGYPNGSPPPPLQVGRRRTSAPSLPINLPSSPSAFPAAAHPRNQRSISDHHSHRASRIHVVESQERDSSNRAGGGNRGQPSQASELFRPTIWSDLTASRPPTAEMDSGRLPPIAMTPRDLACHHCAMDKHIEGLRATAIARGPVFPESPYDHKQQIPTPLPPAHGHTMIPFQPTSSANPGRAFGVSMADILDFRPCLQDPDTPVLDNGVQQVFLTLEAKGYTTFIQTISGNCPHRRISRFNLAYAIASAFDAYLKDFPFNPAGLKAAAIVVRSVEELRLVNLYSRDGRVWRVHVAYVT